jgi:hypothetical protein
VTFKCRYRRRDQAGIWWDECMVPHSEKPVIQWPREHVDTQASVDNMSGKNKWAETDEKEPRDNRSRRDERETRGRERELDRFW